MAIEFVVLEKEKVEETSTFGIVRGIAEKLRHHLDEDSTRQLIRQRHVLGASSAEIQKIVLMKATQLGFHSEKTGLFSSYQVSALRPDYYCPVEDTGILLEVERGKTTTNNMDLLDFWKCHISHHASYLFLVVPRRSPGVPMVRFCGISAKYAGALVRSLTPKNYTNVDAKFLFGY